MGDAMRLTSVYDRAGSAKLLYDLLAEREPWQSISHKEMPEMWRHEYFVLSKPYLGWWLIELDGVVFGACYITKQREIGIHIFKAHQRKGAGKWAINEVMRLHPGKVLANINPANEASIALFKGLGFGHIQNTYAHE